MRRLGGLFSRKEEIFYYFECQRFDQGSSEWTYDKSCDLVGMTTNQFICACNAPGTVGVFKSGIGNDYSAAVGVPIILFLSLLCVFSVWLAKRNSNKVWDGSRSLWTLYPLYSIIKATSTLNPRPTRTLLYWMTISSMALSIAVYFSWIISFSYWGNELVWGTLVGLIFSWIMNYVIGFVHYYFIRRREDRPAPKIVDNITLLVIVFFFLLAMIAVIDMDTTINALLWAACLGIAWLFDNFLFDVIVAILARVKLIRAWVKIRGFYVDPRENVAANPAAVVVRA